MLYSNHETVPQYSGEVMITFPFYAELEPLIGQDIEILTRQRQHQGKLLALHKEFVYMYNQNNNEWQKDIVWLSDITNLRSLAE
jgi:hypothetical protein